MLAPDLLLDETAKVEPKSAYSDSKYKAEQGILKLADKNFCPIILRQGTVYGFSPRMRYDLVVNTMLKEALLNNKILVFCGGEQWRPLIDIEDVASAHIAVIEAPKDKVCGQIFNLVFKNYRVLELSHWVKNALKEIENINPEIIVQYQKSKARTYRISGEKIIKTLDWHPQISVYESVKDMIKKIRKYQYTDFHHPQYYNIEWMKLLHQTVELTQKINHVF
jgi:nucleoside-diphosphate-sugar epimerase